MSDIFISYKREEQPIAKTLADALEKEGWTVWWDPKLRAGEHFDDVIEKALNEAQCVIVMWSQRSVQSRYVRDEATYALDQDKLVPVAINNVKLPFRFRGVHTLSLLGWDGSRDFSEFRRLVEDISTILGPSPMAMAAAEEQRRLQAESQRKAEEERIREQERQRSEEEARRKAEEDNRNRMEKERRPRRQPSTRQSAVEQPKGKLEPGTVFRDTLKDGSQGPEMVVIPAGGFRMGDIHGDGHDAEQPVRTVQIPKSFAIGRYEVTFEEYDRFATAMGRELPSDFGWGRKQRPVINVSWNDAVEYAKWLSAQTGKRYRLPSEAEWEYAARSGGTEERWAGTSVEDELGEYAWYQTNSGGKTQPVRGKKPNSFGLYDMSGNVWEWVQDWWNDNYEGAPTDGRAWFREEEGGHHVLRGGSWATKPLYLYSSHRFRNHADYRFYSVGFRLAQDS